MVRIDINKLDSEKKSEY